MARPCTTGLLHSHPAGAHALLLSSDPASGTVVSASSFDIVLRYNSRVDAKRSRVSLQGPDAATGPEGGRKADAGRDLPADNDAGPATVRVHATDLAPGTYVLHWRVLAIDGHVTRGTFPFTVTLGK